MSLLEKFKAVTTFVFDVDGVLTDGTLTILPEGVMARKMNVKDGYALQLAIKRGYGIAVISGGASDEVADRLHRLGVAEVFMRVTDKEQVLEEYLQKKGLSWHEILFMGDDIPDLEVMKKCGLACCPADAVEEIKEVSAYISPLNGGFGCGRDVIEKVMKIRGNWNEDTRVPST
ncbi:HAD hydrolase family protein [Segetibacter sp.]|jgi:3-deoxy-D-manno-octulosonate 8-phosphate phosphatase (KDO 8-P phosphatase)|uniref:KdsC family phosphatase n=1 Tax=Segetibacter sp. TaxID=2231182 RepID=UPI00260D5675|nr:HAD hydrolase family protein [Segetibacter sp.]MCW3080393.1 3-deoxy-D-manno-octulosonate 8-phosphate phosphatase [Segetibacter sp.]